MTTSATFTGFVPAFPSNREFDLLRFLPQLNRQEDITKALERFTSVLQEVTDLLLADIDRFPEILDPDLAPEPFLDAMLCDLGNPFEFDLTEIDKRRLILILVALYKQKGTCVGIENAIRFFVRIQATCVPFLAECLALGEAELGEDWILCPSSSFSRFAFEIVSPVVLTDEQRRQIFDICEYMKPAHTHCVQIVEPDLSVVDPLELGLSELGVDWTLH